MKYRGAILLFLVAMAGCKQAENQAEKTPEVYNVRVTEPVYSVFREPVRTVGVLSTRMEVKLSFKTGGIVSSVSVNEGQKVEEGERLASLDLSEISASTRQASIAYEKARRDYRRARNLYKDSVITLETLQDARSAYDVALSRKKVADFNLEYSIIKAPANGIVQKILIDEDEMIAPGHPAIIFATTENDWIVRVALADRDIVRFSTGDSAVIEMDAFPERRFPAEISEVGTFADPVTGTFEAELKLDVTDPEFRSGLIARAHLFPSDSIEGWWIPFEAVRDLHESRGIVFVVDSGIVNIREVRTGQMINEGLVIREGLQGDERVVNEGADFIEEGSRVHILSKETKN